MLKIFTMFYQYVVNHLKKLFSTYERFIKLQAGIESDRASISLHHLHIVVTLT
jgi:hypothetical protein